MSVWRLGDDRMAMNRGYEAECSMVESRWMPIGQWKEWKGGLGYAGIALEGDALRISESGGSSPLQTASVSTEAARGNVPTTCQSL